MRIYELIVEPDREDHIARHGISVAEVQDIVFGSFIAQRTREDRFLLIGQTIGGRYLTIIIASRGLGTFGLVTARIATDAERRRFRSNRRR